MDETSYIALVQIHDQPPIDTQAKIETHSKCFPSNATMDTVWKWASKWRERGDPFHRIIIQLEIRPNE